MAEEGQNAATYAAILCRCLTTWTRHATHLGRAACRVGDEIDHQERGRAVERSVGKVELLRVAGLEASARVADPIPSLELYAWDR